MENENNLIENTSSINSDGKLSEKWQRRFQFINDNGYPGVFIQTKEWRNALRKLSFRERMKVAFNFYAMFFCIIYLLILGLWKKAIACFFLVLVVGIISEMFNIQFMSIFVNVFVASRVNAWYYDRKVKGKQDWSL